MNKMLLAALIVSTPALSDPLLVWDAPTQFEDGKPIEASLILDYNIYLRQDGSALPAILFGTTRDTTFDLVGAPEGCNQLYTTALRGDTAPPMESQPSNSIVVCDHKAPSPPGNLRVNLQISVGPGE